MPASRAVRHHWSVSAPVARKKLTSSTPRVHSDGIALSPDREYLYFQALTARTMYRIPTAALREGAMTGKSVATAVEKAADSGAADGLAFSLDGHLYISALEEDAIKRLTPTGEIEVVVRDPRISWPDSFAVARDGTVYFTTAQIHRGARPEGPFALYRIRRQ